MEKAEEKARRFAEASQRAADRAEALALEYLEAGDYVNADFYAQQARAYRRQAEAWLKRAEEGVV
jgi:hypothetical protein